MSRKCRKLKTVERSFKPRRSDILVRPQLSRHPIPRRRREIKFSRISPPLDVDATGEVLLGSAIAGPVGALMGVGSAALRAFGRMGTETVKRVRETAEKTKELEEKTLSERTS